MRIAYTYHAFLERRYGGISRYLVRLAEEIGRRGHDTRLFPGIHQNAFVGRSATGSAPGLNLGFLPEVPKGLIAPFNQLICGRQIARWQPDILHETLYAARGIPGAKQPVVITVHDLIHEKLPDCCYKAQHHASLKRKAIERADQIICVSECTRTDLLSCYDVDEARVATVHHGIDLRPRPAPGDKGRERIILYVGLRALYKNFARLARAFAASGVLKSNYTLVAFGGKPFSSEERRLFRDLRLGEGRVRHVSGGDEVLSGLYSGAALFVYPSLYEGFGIPPLEAMAHGCPVAASNTSSIPEVVGDAALLFDPWSVEEIQGAMENLLADEARRNLLVQRGFARLARFTWENCAAATLEVYRRLA